MHLFILLFSSLPAFAVNAPACGGAANLNELFRCAEQRAPALKAADYTLAEANAKQAVYAERRNPDLGLESFHGSVAGVHQAESNLALGFPLELGGKRAARAEVGLRAVGEAEAAKFRARAELRRGLLLNLHRYRQAQHEREVVEESIGSFAKLLGQYGARASLSPEQETSAAVYRMAKSEYELKKAVLLDELDELDGYFFLNLGTRGSALKNLLPPSPAEWPALSAKVGEGGSPAMAERRAARLSAEAALSLAKSESWPTLMVGPSIRRQEQGGAVGALYGFNVGLTLPVFHAGGSARAAAAKRVEASDQAQTLSSAAEGAEREVQAAVYGRSTALLKSTLSHREIERAHGAIEGLFARGVVPSPLVIEAHRSYFELEKARNERERKAIDALLQIRTIDGTILEDTL